MNFKPETQLSIVFYYRVSIEWMLNYDLKVSRWYYMLTCKAKWFKRYSPFFLFLFFVVGFFFLGGGGNHIQQLIILKVIMIERGCLQF